MKLVFLVSGNGGNLKFINSCINEGFIQNCKPIVIADRECGALNYSRQKGIENYLINYSRENNNELIELLKMLNADLIVTNIHKILDGRVVKLYKNKLINLHYSLLPAYSGMIGDEPIRKAMNYAKFLGITLHYVEEQVVCGEVIIQGVVKNIGDENYIINKVFRMGCFSLLYYIYLKYPEVKQHHSKEILNQEEYIFSPELNFDVVMFNESFWDIVRG